MQEKVANQEPDAEEKIEQLTQYSMLEQYDGDVLSNIIDKVLIYNDKDIEVVFTLNEILNSTSMLNLVFLSS